jgi:hypothetical protein
MVKSYYLTYGVKAENLDEFGQFLGQLLGMTVELRDSLYRGEYVNCIGMATDILTIETHEEGDGTVKDEYEHYAEYPFILEASNHKGKNVDKELRHDKLKQVLSTLPALTLLKESVFESKN